MGDMADMILDDLFLYDFEYGWDEGNPLYANKKVSGPGECPVCGERTLLRTGKYGKFYGCAAFPACKGSRKYIEPPKEPIKLTKRVQVDIWVWSDTVCAMECPFLYCSTEWITEYGCELYGTVLDYDRGSDDTVYRCKRCLKGNKT